MAIETQIVLKRKSNKQNGFPKPPRARIKPSRERVACIDCNFHDTAERLTTTPTDK
jgi:hypothetical protein